MIRLWRFFFQYRMFETRQSEITRRMKRLRSLELKREAK